MWRFRPIAAALSLTLCVAAILAWATHRQGATFMDYRGTSRGCVCGVRPMGVYLAIDALDIQGDRSGWRYSTTAMDRADFPRRFGGFQWGAFPAGGPDSGTVDFLVIPYWFLIAAPACLPVALARGRARRGPRFGTCVQCDYDLRATPDQCPECGHRVATIGRT